MHPQHKSTRWNCGTKKQHHKIQNGTKHLPYRTQNRTQRSNRAIKHLPYSNQKSTENGTNPIQAWHQASAFWEVRTLHSRRSGEKKVTTNSEAWNIMEQLIGIVVVQVVALVIEPKGWLFDLFVARPASGGNV